MNNPVMFSRPIILITAVFILLLLPVLDSSLNLSTFLWLNAEANQLIPSAFWATVTNLGDGFFALTLASILFINNPHRMKTVIVTALLSLLLIQAFKAGLAIDRPPKVLDPETFTVLGKAFKRGSMPSGHTATAFLLAGLIWHSYNSRIIKSIAVGMALVAGFSRIPVGVHWPADILVGAISGWLCSTVAFYITNKPSTKQHPLWKQELHMLATALFGLIFAVALALHNTRLGSYPGVLASQYTLATVALLISLVQLGKTVPPVICRGLQWLEKNHADKLQLGFRFIRFGMVGASGFVVDMSIYMALTFFGMPHLLGRAGAYWVSASWNWMMNRRFTFHDTEKTARTRQWLKYLTMCAISFLPNWGTYYLLTTGFDFFAEWKPLALIIGVAAGMLFNFTGANLFIFKHEKKGLANKMETVA